MFEDNRSVPEPAGALAVAGLKRYVADRGARGQTLVAIESGANMGFDRLRHVAERAELGEAREALLAVTIPEAAGSFLRFCEGLGPLPITEFNYRYSDAEAAHLFVGVGLRGGWRRARRDRRGDPRERLPGRRPHGRRDGQGPRPLHGRRAARAGSASERLCSFEFPERPGALLSFLRQLSGRWSITLFHYRNHGAAFGRVLAGIQVARRTGGFERRSTASATQYRDESSNPAYALFLGEEP